MIIITINTYFEGLAQALKGQLETGGIKVEVMTFNPRTTDFRSAITRFKREKLEAAVVFLLEGGDLAAFLRQARELKLETRLYGHDVTYDESIAHNPDLAEGVVFFKYVATAGGDLLDRYRSRFKMEPTFSVPMAYDNVFLIKDAIERCGDERGKIRDCLQSADYKGASGRMRFNESGNLLSDAKITWLYQVKNGNFAALE